MATLEKARTDMVTKVEGYIDAAKAAYDLYTARSFDQKVRTLAPGQPAPEAGVFYDDQNKEDYNTKIQDLDAAAADAIEKYIDTLATAAVTEPTEEVLRAVQMFVLIDPATITRTEFQTRVDDMIRRYGESMLTYETIRSFAARYKYIIPEHPEAKERAGAAAIRANIRQFFDGCYVSAIENKAAISEGAIAFAKMALENLAAGREVLAPRPVADE